MKSCTTAYMYSKKLSCRRSPPLHRLGTVTRAPHRRCSVESSSGGGKLVLVLVVADSRLLATGSQSRLSSFAIAGEHIWSTRATRTMLQGTGSTFFSTLNTGVNGDGLCELASFSHCSMNLRRLKPPPQQVKTHYKPPKRQTALGRRSKTLNTYHHWIV